MSLQRNLELAAASYLRMGVPGLTVRTTEESDKRQAPQMALALCPEARGVPGLLGVESCRLVVELRTVLSLTSPQGDAISGHYALFKQLKEMMTMDDLKEQLPAYGSDIGINGIDVEPDLKHENLNGTLVDSITRVIHAVSKQLQP